MYSTEIIKINLVNHYLTAPMWPGILLLQPFDELVKIDFYNDELKCEVQLIYVHEVFILSMNDARTFSIAV